MTKEFVIGFNESSKERSNFPLELDAQKYIGELSELDLSEAQKLELLEVLFSIMYSFVQLGFDVKSCGQILENFALAAQSDSYAVDSPNQDEKGEVTDERRAP